MSEIFAVCSECCENVYSEHNYLKAVDEFYHAGWKKNNSLTGWICPDCISQGSIVLMEKKLIVYNQPVCCQNIYNKKSDEFEFVITFQAEDFNLQGAFAGGISIKIINKDIFNDGGFSDVELIPIVKGLIKANFSIFPGEAPK